MAHVKTSKCRSLSGMAPGMSIQIQWKRIPVLSCSRLGKAQKLPDFQRDFRKHILDFKVILAS